MTSRIKHLKGSDEDERPEYCAQTIQALEHDLQTIRVQQSTLRQDRDLVWNDLIRTRNALKRLQNEAVEDRAEERTSKSWFAHIFRVREPEEAKEARTQRVTGRVTRRIVHEVRQDRYLAKINFMDDSVRANEEVMRREMLHKATRTCGGTSATTGRSGSISKGVRSREPPHFHRRQWCN
ncbi:hypothetical protein BKA67DRAFT_585787 [Truncatella angustata]|uniref:Uncharacterized protein n=1 Tax=Truncatella angustata TaxID=152316 RepID=A0A9P8UCC5_9PEZI|nr:uncharacterized protein BKA67DRAFT_585787 [Truncatella angustata]KAH6645607.1 hypothetical protein BKA67DRAFT_585787 [Truncatella angustata]